MWGFMKRILKYFVCFLLFVFIAVIGFGLYLYIILRIHMSDYESFKSLPLYKEDLLYDGTTKRTILVHLFTWNIGGSVAPFEFAKYIKEKEGDNIRVIVFFYKDGKYADFIHDQVERFGKFDEVVILEDPYVLDAENRNNLITNAMMLKTLDFKTKLFSKEQLHHRIDLEIELYRKYRPFVIFTPGFSVFLSAQYANIPTWTSMPLLFIKLPFDPLGIHHIVRLTLTYFVTHLFSPTNDVFKEVALEKGIRPSFPVIGGLFLNPNKLFLKEYPELMVQPPYIWEWLLKNTYSSIEEIDYIGPVEARFVSKDPNETKNLLDRIEQVHDAGELVVFFSLGSYGSEFVEVSTNVIISLNNQIDRLQKDHGIGLVISPMLPIFRDDPRYTSEVEDSLNDKIIVLDFIESYKINPEVDVCVLHGGSGTLTISVEAECPTVGLPLSEEQRGNIDDLVRSGAANVVDWESVVDDGELIIVAIEEIVGDYETFKDAARKYKNMIPNLNGREIYLEKTKEWLLKRERELGICNKNASIEGK